VTTNETAATQDGQTFRPPERGEHIPDVVEFPVGPIRFRFAEPGDEAALLAAVDRGFAKWPPFPTGGTREEHVRWFIDSWKPGENLSTIAEHDGRIAAFGLGYRRGIWIRGQRLVSGLGAYGAVDPDYRRMYLNLWFGEWKRQRDGRDVGGAFTQVEALQRSRQRRGTGVPLGNPLTVFGRIFNPLTASGHPGLDGLKRAPGYFAMQAEGLVQRRRAPARRWSIRDVGAFDERVDALAEECAQSEFDYLPGRNHEFLNWRYFDRRTGPAIGLLAEDGDQLLGYAVLRPIQARGHIADILARPGRVDVARSLIDQGLRRLRLDGLAGVECTLPLNHAYIPALRRAGFVRLPERSRVMTLKFSVSRRIGSTLDLDFLADPHARMHVTMGDSDMV
jgi:hypothetical protein